MIIDCCLFCVPFEVADCHQTKPYYSETSFDNEHIWYPKFAFYERCFWVLKSLKSNWSIRSLFNLELANLTHLIRNIGFLVRDSKAIAISKYMCRARTCQNDFIKAQLLLFGCLHHSWSSCNFERIRTRAGRKWLPSQTFQNNSEMPHDHHETIDCE